MNLKTVFDVMAFAQANGFTPTATRGILTHANARLLKPYTVFSGNVTAAAIEAARTMRGEYVGHTLIVEHPEKMQRGLTDWIRENVLNDYDAFEREVRHLSTVNIATRLENAALSQKGATYESLGITLVVWADIPADVQRLLYVHCVGKRCGNHAEFIPRAAT